MEKVVELNQLLADATKPNSTNSQAQNRYIKTRIDENGQKRLVIEYQLPPIQKIVKAAEKEVFGKPVLGTEFSQESHMQVE